MEKIVKKYLGIDWGEVRIGLALGDDENKIAVPLAVANGLDEIIEKIKKEEIDEVVVGEPLAMISSELVNKKRYSAFIGSLQDNTSLPIHTIDERLTSKAADALAGDKKTKAARDAIAAMLILQSFFDSQT